MARKNTAITHTLSNGKEIKVVEQELFGMFESDLKQITVIPSKANSNREELDTYVHELLHAEFPKWTEKRVATLATSIAGLLWALGYRKAKKKS